MAKKSSKKNVVVEEVMESQVTPTVEEVAQEVATPEVEGVKAAVNEEKVNTMLTIEEITELYTQSGIKCHNPNAKGPYRIMGGAKGSSLNLLSKKGEYKIYSTGDDLKLVQEAKLPNEDLIIEVGTNAQDPSRPNTIICKTVETLKALLGVYATNPVNVLPVATTEAE